MNERCDAVRLVFWQNMVSIHQVDLLQALAEREGHQVQLVADEVVPEWRSRAGWAAPQLKAVQLVVAPSLADARQMVAQAPEISVHFVSGFDAYAGPRQALQLLLQLRVESRQGPSLVIAFEQWDNRGWRGWLRSLKYNSRVRSYRRRVDAFLLVGNRERANLGAHSSHVAPVYPYAYFLDSPEEAPAHERGTQQGPVRLAFVGRMVPLKRVDLLLTALARQDPARWTLDLFGDGEMIRTWREAARLRGLATRLTWHGAVSNEAVKQSLHGYDLVVLPSDYDGWGTVVNEALQAGCRAVVSSGAGSSDLLAGGGGPGQVFAKGSVAGLQSTLARELARGRLSAEERQQNRAWAESRISPQVGARYVSAVADASRRRDASEVLVAPWLQ